MEFGKRVPPDDPAFGEIDSDTYTTLQREAQRFYEQTSHLPMIEGFEALNNKLTLLREEGYSELERGLFICYLETYRPSSH